MSLPRHFLVVCYSLVSAQATPSLRSGYAWADTTVSSSFLLLHGTAVADNIVVWCSDHQSESTCSTKEQQHTGLARGLRPLARLPHSLSLVRSVRRAVMANSGYSPERNTSVNYGERSGLPPTLAITSLLTKKRCQPLCSQVRTEAGIFVFGGCAPSPLRGAGEHVAPTNCPESPCGLC